MRGSDVTFANLGKKMQLIEIDKARYRRHLNITITVAVVSFASLGVGLSSLLIHFFGAAPGENFWLNLLGVAIAALLVGKTLQSLKARPWFTEIAYVWQLKQELNLINRRLRALQAAVKVNDHNALIVMLFNYQGSRQLWLLDDNTLNLQELEVQLAQLELQIQQLNLPITVTDYHRNLLDNF